MNIVKVIEVKTPNCSRCKMIEPSYKALKAKYSDKVIFEEKVLGIDPEAKELMMLHNLKSAPSFVVYFESIEECMVVNFEALETLFNE